VVTVRALAPLALLLTVPAAAAPPPPPPTALLDTTQAYIRSLNAKDSASYGSLLAAGFAGYDIDGKGPLNRDRWMKKINDAFASKAFFATVRQVFSDGERIMLIERINHIQLRDGVPGDCCVYHLAETLTLDGGKIVRIDRSPMFDTELSPTGERTD
jgi:hypothetical protein